MSDLHPALAPLAFMIGTWKGEGRGCYPTIEPFEYVEEATYSPGPGKPFIAYTQRTRRVGNDEPLHTEFGYIRPIPSGGAELVVSQPTGIVEVHTGDVEAQRISFRSRLVGLTPSAVRVEQVERRIMVADDTMHYRLAMEAAGQAMQLHLEAELVRIGG